MMSASNNNICIDLMNIFFFKQKTAYEIGTGDWSSDVCSSDLRRQKLELRIGKMVLHDHQ